MFIPDHSQYSLCRCFFMIIKNEKVYFALNIAGTSRKKRNEYYFFQKSLVTKFLHASCPETFVDDDSALGLMIDQLYPPWQASLTSPLQSHNNPVQDLQSHIHSLSSYLHGNCSAPAQHLSEVHRFKLI